MPSGVPGGLFLKNKLSESLGQKKPLWRYIKSKRRNGNCVYSLNENDQLHSNSRRKAKMINNQFCSVFTSEDTTNISKLPVPPNTEMSNFEITFQGVSKLLKGLNGGKASGPGKLPNLILKNAVNEISPFLKIIFDQSLPSGKSTDDKILTPVQNGFRSKNSCESQLILITTIQNFEGKTQIDVVLDFSKAFDVVPHQRLLHKLDHYGIQRTKLN